MVKFREFLKWNFLLPNQLLSKNYDSEIRNPWTGMCTKSTVL